MDQNMKTTLTPSRIDEIVAQANLSQAEAHAAAQGNYTLFAGDTFRQEYRTLRQALRQFGLRYQTMDCTLRKSHSCGRSSVGLGVVEPENGEILIPAYHRKHLFKMSHHWPIVKGEK